MCSLTIILLIFPGTKLDLLWRLNPSAHAAFQSLGRASIFLMVIVGTACALTAFGLWRRTRWGLQLAMVILCVNAIGDLLNAILRHDYRSLIGLPVAGAMIFYLSRRLNPDNSRN